MFLNRSESISFLLFCVALLLPVSANAASNPTLWSLRIANDSFFAQDRGYTSGLELEVTPAHQPWSLFLGQDIFTPDADRTSQPPPGQHPYGAWLYLGGEYRTALRHNMLLTSALTLGTTGERAMGEELQDLAHTVLGFNEYEGWDSQISERWGWILQLRLEGRLPLWHNSNNLGADIIAFAEGRGGNIYVDANAGAMLRFGRNLPELEAEYRPQEDSSLFLTCGYNIRAVDRNVFLEGVKDSDYAVEPERTYDRFQAGIHWRYDPWRIDLDVFIPQQFFTSQKLNCRYGVLTLSYWF